MAADRAQRSLVKNLADERLLAIATELERNERCSGFRVEARDVAAERLRAEVGFRGHMREACGKGEDLYCFVCRGRCESEEQHERNVLRAYPPLSDAVRAVHEMSRAKLVEALLKERGLVPTPAES